MPRSRELAELATSYDSGGLLGFRNRIINGAMVIDQRNNGASVTPTTLGSYTVDRWCVVISAASKFSVQQSSVAPSGFTKSALITSLSAYSVGAGDYFAFCQRIEGFNAADLAWGTASAATVTLSFWVRSSLTGTFGGSLDNSDATYSYPFSYTISSANTWEQKSITIAGSINGTWNTTNGGGIELRIGLGTGSTFSGTAGAWAAGNFVQPTGTVSVVGTNGATFYITGVQLEAGSVATPFERRDYGRELAMCYRYYRRFPNSGSAYTAIGAGSNASTTSIIRWGFSLDTPMRTAPSVSFTNCVGWDGTLGGAATASTSYTTVNNIDLDVTTSGISASVGRIAKVLMTSTGFVELGGAEL
jgi:hypothetical protein